MSSDSSKSKHRKHSTSASKHRSSSTGSTARSTQQPLRRSTRVRKPTVWLRVGSIVRKSDDPEDESYAEGPGPEVSSEEFWERVYASSDEHQPAQNKDDQEDRDDQEDEEDHLSRHSEPKASKKKKKMKEKRKETQSSSSGEDEEMGTLARAERAEPTSRARSSTTTSKTPYDLDSWMTMLSRATQK